MSSPTVIKLTKPGETLTLNVHACALNKMGTYPDVSFTGIDGNRLVELRVPQKSADRQLERLGFSYADCVGKSLVFSRDPNQTDPAKPYWGITLPQHGNSSSAPVGTEPAFSAQHQEEAGRQQIARIADESRAALYQKITRYALDHILPLYAAKNITVTMEGTAAIVATLYIQVNKQG